MPKLYFRYGTMASAKSLNLLSVAETYRWQGKKVVTVKPAIDDRHGRDVISSRGGKSEVADVVLEPDALLYKVDPWDYENIGPVFSGAKVVLVDEAQFLTTAQVDQFRHMASYFFPVICYGLRADYQSHLFEGSRRLFEVADNIEEIKTTCHYCNKKSIMNLRLSREGPQILIGQDGYQPACWKCWNRHMQNHY